MVNDFHTKVKWLFLLRELGVQLCQLGQMNFFMVTAQLLQKRHAVLLIEIATVLGILKTQS